MKTFNLSPVDGRKSLNNHHVNQYDVDGVTMSDLISYTTKVASYNHSKNEMIVYCCPSKTTARHINAFLHFYGFDSCKVSELKKYKP